MDAGTIIGMVAPLILTFIVQGLKKIMAINGYVALIIVFAIGGIGAIVGVGPVPGTGFIDTTVNAGFIIGLATFLYSIFKKRT